tara:strand:- start:117 stop:539 length:423 start_codon:yes stop_codon:yes gene_type:complete
MLQTTTMKNILFTLALLIFSCEETSSQKEELVTNNIEPVIEKVEKTIEDKIINSLSENQKKELFNLILNAQDQALKEAKAIVTDDNNFEKRYDVQLELQAKYELDVYKKQSWWKEINKDVKTANKIRDNISLIGIESGWL